MAGENTTNLDGFLKDRYTNNTANESTRAGFKKLSRSKKLNSKKIEHDKNEPPYIPKGVKP